MKALKPLFRLLQRPLRAAVLRRGIAWLACALILIVLGSTLTQLAGDARVIRLGLIMAALSAFPAFLLWPLSGKRLLDRLRSIDEETVFEAYLEAEPGPVREILRRLAAERASALSFRDPPREPVWAGLGGLCSAAIACLVLVEGSSFLVLGRSVTLPPERPVQAQSGKRIEETGYSDFATEAPAARRARRERAMEREEQERQKGENPALGTSSESPARTATTNRRPQGGADSSDPTRQDELAQRRQGERDAEGMASGMNSSPTPGEASDPENRKTSESGSSRDQTGLAQRENSGPERNGPPPAPGRTGQGYEHTADTKVPSPLLDYRSRFEARYAERTGQRVSASGRMGFGALRGFQRRYFDSFTLKAEVGTTEDPYVAQLKRRWMEVKGGAW